jgi:hypothetical protein
MRLTTPAWRHISRHGSVKYPDKASIVTEIYRRFNDGEPLNYASIRRSDESLRKRATYLFGGWGKAVEYAGIPYASVMIDTNIASASGYALEALFGDILTELNVYYTQYEHERYNPDYVLADDVWIDVKLSAWTIYSRSDDTLAKYEPHCKSLTIVFLRGDKTCDRMVTPKTRLVNVNHYVKQLPRAKQRYYSAKLRDIEASVA